VLVKIIGGPTSRCGRVGGFPTGGGKLREGILRRGTRNSPECREGVNSELKGTNKEGSRENKLGEERQRDSGEICQDVGDFRTFELTAPI